VFRPLLVLRVNGTTTMQKALSLPRHHVVSDHPKYLSVGQVRIRYGWSNSTIARRLCSAGFPAPIRLGGKTAARRWSIADLEAWEASKAEAKDEAAS
jgi:predicted DNA-binding transcriptional regulator AlpA